MASQLTTLAAFKTFMGVTDTVAARDALWTDLITECSAQIENALQREVLAADHSQIIDGTSQRELLVKQTPINSVALLKVDGRTIPAASSTVNGYRFEGGRIWMIPYGSYFPRGIGNIEVTYNAGYTEVPPDLELLVQTAVANVYKGREWIGFSSKSLAGETVSFRDELDKPQSKAIMNNYKRVTP